MVFMISNLYFLDPLEPMIEKVGIKTGSLHILIFRACNSSLNSLPPCFCPMFLLHVLDKFCLSKKSDTRDARRNTSLDWRATSYKYGFAATLLCKAYITLEKIRKFNSKIFKELYIPRPFNPVSFYIHLEANSSTCNCARVVFKNRAEPTSE